MGEGEVFSWKKFFDFSALSFAKVGGIATKVGLVIAAIIVVKMICGFIFGPKSSLENKPSIQAQAGSRVEYNVTQETTRSGWSTDALGGGIKMPDNDEWGYFLGGKIGYEW